MPVKRIVSRGVIVVAVILDSYRHRLAGLEFNPLARLLV